MKKTILKLLFLAICTFSITAQSQATFTGLKKDYTQSMDSLLTYVNKAPINTGILYDRVMSFSSLNMIKENGVITKSNYQNFIQSWSELYRSAYSPTFLSLENLKTNINANINTNLVDIGIVNTKMNYIDYGTPTTPSLNTVGGYLYDVTGINPFLEKQITVIAPLKERVPSGTVTFRLLSSFMLQLTGLPIKNLTANFGTGTTYNLITNTVVSTTNPVVTFTTSGKKEFVFTITFSDNTTEILNATMNVIVPAASTARTTAFDLEEDFVASAGITPATIDNIAFQGYNEAVPSKGVLEYRTYYNLMTNNGSAKSKIKKPIIILDGYDPGDGRKIYQGSIGYDSPKSSLYELMYYDHDNNSATDKVSLVEKLRSLPYGFDVTLVNFPNGADYVERNAMALVALLTRENAKLTANGSTEKISIIGPSMGGLVSRYALSYMEKNGINHNTKLWVSFDSPHLGANIPIGAQENLYFYGYKGRQDQAKLKFDENFRSPAARQMLIEQLDGKHEAYPYPTDLWRTANPNGQNNNSSFRQQFQVNLNSNGLSGSNGYPQNLRKIALINGTTNGTKTNGEGQKFLELAAFTIIKYGQIFGTPIQTKIKVATIEDSFLQNIGGTGQTFSGKVTIKRVGGLEVQNGSVSRTNSNPRGSMDNVQGGTFNTQGIIKDEFTLALNDAVDSQEWRQYLPNHAFIPSVSSLAFKNPNFDWSSAISRNLVCDPLNKEIYFDTYFAPSTNQEHVFVSAENANWLIKELQGMPQAPSFPVQASELTGASAACIGVNTTYSFADVCKVPSSATWSVSSNMQVVSATGYSVTVSGLSSGSGTITATFASGVAVTKPIWVGLPSLPTFLKGPATVITGALVNYNGGTSLGATSYEWWLPYPYDTVSSFDYFGQNWQKLTNYSDSNYIQVFTGYAQNAGLVQLMGKNACGCGGAKTIQVSHGSGGGGQIPRMANPEGTSWYTIYPNPASDFVNIELRDQSLKPITESKIIAELYDLMGHKKGKVEIVNTIAKINVAGLPKGIYVLNINIDGQIEGHQVIVE